MEKTKEEIKKDIKDSVDDFIGTMHLRDMELKMM